MTKIKGFGTARLKPRPFNARPNKLSLDGGADGFHFGVQLQYFVAHLAAPA